VVFIDADGQTTTQSGRLYVQFASVDAKAESLLHSNVQPSFTGFGTLVASRIIVALFSTKHAFIINLILLFVCI
jgi:hypothetical protein